MISHLNGGNCTHEEAEAWREEFADAPAGWDGTLTDTATPASFAQTVIGARFVAGLGLNPVITAAAVHRHWFALQIAERVSVPGASDAFVAAVHTALEEAGHVQDHERTVSDRCRQSPRRVKAPASDLAASAARLLFHGR